MIRFVDLRGQGVGARFAFWDTIVDQFITIRSPIGTAQAWGTWEEFEEEAEGLPLYRFRRLCPPWVFEPATAEELGFPEDQEL